MIIKNIKYVSIIPTPTMSSFEGKASQTNNKNKEKPTQQNQSHFDQVGLQHIKLKFLW